MESPRFKFFRPIFEKVCVCHTCWELKNFFWKSFETFLKMYWMESNFFFFFKKKGLRWKINCLVSLEELIRLNPKQIWCLRSPRESSSENVVIFYGKLKKKKYLLLVRLEIRRESDKSIGSDSNLFFFFFVGQSHLSEERIRSKRIFLFSFFSPSSRLIIEMVAIRKLIAS